MWRFKWHHIFYYFIAYYSRPRFLLAAAQFRVMAGKAIWKIDDMDKIPRLNKKIVNITSLDDIEEEKKYWFSKSPLDRIEAIQINRKMIYGSVLLGEEYVR